MTPTPADPSDPASPRNPWARAIAALAQARQGRYAAARDLVEQLRYHPDVPAEMRDLVIRQLQDATPAGADIPWIDTPADYLGHPELGLHTPFRRVHAEPGYPKPFPPHLALPGLVGVRNDAGFVLDAASVLADRIGQRMRRVEIILCEDEATDVAAVLQGLARQEFDGALRLTVLSPRPGDLPDLPTALSPRVVPAPILSELGRAAVQDLLNADGPEADDPLIVFLSGTAVLDPTALQRAAFTARASRRVLQPLMEGDGDGGLDTRFRTDRQHKLFRGRYPFRDLQGINLAAPAALLREIGLPDPRFQSLAFAARELAFRAYSRGAYIAPLQISRLRHARDEAAFPEDAVLFNALAPNHWDRKADGRFEVPRITVYIPAYNAGKYIRAAVDSVLDQDIQDFEVCICNDGALDDTIDVLEAAYASESRVRWTSTRNGGIGHASNTAIRMGRAPYIGQLDSDDRLKSGALRRLADYLDENPETACVYGSCERIDASGAYVSSEYRWPEFSREKMMVTSIAHHFRMWRRSAWERSGYFRQDIVNAIDYDILLKMSETGPVHHIDEVLYQRRWHGENTSAVFEGDQTANTHRVQTEALRRQGLQRFWEVHVPDPEHPRKITYRRRAGVRTVVFWPDYSRVNPYQQMLYGPDRAQTEICAGDIDAALMALSKADDPGSVTFHLHWLNFVLMEASDPTDAAARAESFVDKVHRFVWKGGHFVWTIHNTISHETRFHDAEVQLSTRLAELAHVLHLHSAASVDEVAASFPIDRAKVQIARHGHYIGAYPDFVSRRAARLELGLAPAEEVILFSGQLRAYKGVTQLVQAFRRVLAQRPKARLLVVGEAKSDPFAAIEPALTPAEASRILTTGRFVTNMELQVFFNAADIAVYPYQRILTSGSLMLALSFGLPALVPRVGMTSEVLHNSEAGALYDPDIGAEGLAQAMSGLLSRVLRDPDRTALRDRIKAHAKGFDWQPMQAILQPPGQVRQVS